MKLGLWSLTLLLALSVAGCKKKPVATEVEEAPVEEAEAAAPVAEPQDNSAAKEKLTAAEAVRAAMEKKQYQTAVGMVLRLQSSAQNEAQLQEAAMLKQEVKLDLMEVSNRDPKAFEALGMLRATTMGR